MERKWVISAFLDISGFRSWTYRASTAPEDKERFIENFYNVLQDYVRLNPDVWAKYEGDGIMLIREFTPEERREKKNIELFILSLRCLYRKVRKARLYSEEWPPGERIRIISGYTYKFMVLDPGDSLRQRKIPEYLEYITNSIRGLLEVNPEIPCLATKGTVKSVGKKRQVLRVRPLRKPSFYPKGVNREDIDGLEIVAF